MAMASLYPSWVVEDALVTFSLPAVRRIRKLSCPPMLFVWLISRHWEPDFLHLHREPSSVRATTSDLCKPKVRTVTLSSIKVVRRGAFRLVPLAKQPSDGLLPLPFAVPVNIRPMGIERFWREDIWQIRPCESVPKSIFQRQTSESFGNVLDAPWKSPRVKMRQDRTQQLVW